MDTGLVFNIYNTGPNTWGGYTGPTFSCDQSSSFGLSLGCVGGTWTLGSYASFSSPAGQIVTPTSLSPFMLSASGPTDFICGATFNLTIGEV